MNADVDFDRRLASWLIAEASGHAPAEILATSLQLIDRTTQHRSPTVRLGQAWPTAASRRRSLLIAIALLALLAGALAAGALQRRQPPAIMSESLVTVRQDQLKGGPLISVRVDDPKGGGQVLLLGTDGLGGSWDGSTAAISQDGHLALGIRGGAAGSHVAIVDLRDLSAPPRLPDWFGDGSWGPGGRWMGGDPGSTLVSYDVATGHQTFTDASTTGASWLDYAAGAQTTDGSGAFVMDGSGRIGTLAFDGTFTVGSRAVVDDGLWSRRVGPDGAYLRCLPPPGNNLSCASLMAISQPAVGPETQTTVWRDPQPGRAIWDYAWAVDGGFWLLTGSADGQAGVDLVRVSADGTERRVATLPSSPAEAGTSRGATGAPGATPAPVASYAAATFGAMAPDDRYLVVNTALPPDGQGGPTYLVNTDGGGTQTVDGTIAGWLLPDSLTRPTQSAEPITTVATVLQGDWVRSAQASAGAALAPRVSIANTSARITAGSQAPTFLDLTPVGDGRLRVDQHDAAFGCDPGASATYGWTTTSDGVDLTAISEPCSGRRAILEGSFERSLPYSGNFEPHTPGDTRYLVPEMGIRLTIPGSGASVWSHTASGVALGLDESWWVITRLDGQNDTVCGGTPIKPGLDSVLAYLDSLGLRGVSFVDRVDGTVAGQRAVTGTIRRSPDAQLGGPDGGFCQAWPGRAGGVFVNDGDRLTLLELPDGRVYSIFARGDLGWARDLTESVEFLDR